ncbi:MAG: type III pantothenate kinase [Bacteroidales bacterium]|nr:type III pantothenate kinase [Bacteroidales bacterium]
MDLVIDIGNTLQKVAVFSEKGVLCDLFSEKKLSISFLEAIFCRYSIKRAIVSSVSKDDETVLQWLDERTRLQRFSASCLLPIRIQYATPKTLGTDRIANAVGANALYPNRNILSIMAGTCLVADFVNEKGEYLGGSIAPGVRMRFQALSQLTARLPFVEPKKIDFFVGDSTENSILSGVMNGITQEIEGLIRQYSRHYDRLKVILSGGDAELLQNSIKKRIFAAQNPILVGLHKILVLNASKS